MKNFLKVLAALAAIIGLIVCLTHVPDKQNDGDGMGTDYDDSFPGI